MAAWPACVDCHNFQFFLLFLSTSCPTHSGYMCELRLAFLEVQPLGRLLCLWFGKPGFGFVQFTVFIRSETDDPDGVCSV